MIATDSPTAADRRSVLCVPATDSTRIVKALRAGADEVVVDLEDAVAPRDKEAARAVLESFDWSARDPQVLLSVRVNAPRSPWCHRDLECVVSRVPARSIVLPKVECAGDLAFAERLLDGFEAEFGRTEMLEVQALVETARGLTGLAEIVADSAGGRLTSLIIGYADLAASLGRTSTPEGSWIAAQEAVLWAARTAGLVAVDGPFLGVADDGPFREAATASAGLGFDSKWAIHPRQVPALNEIFQPSASAVARARQVLEALDAAASIGRGAVQVGGQLVDEAMAVAARRTLARAAR